MTYVYVALGINTVSIVLIVVFYIRFIKRYNKTIETINDCISKEVTETQKRIEIVSNALPKTPKEGALGYKVTMVK